MTFSASDGDERKMSRPTDIRPVSVSLYFLPVRARMPLKFGAETMTEVTCARVKLAVADRSGRIAEGWGETPLSVQWVWPSALSYEIRHSLLKSFCVKLAERWASFAAEGHPMEIGQDFSESELIDLWKTIEPIDGESFPWLAALVCDSAFDIALHDAFANLINLPVYQTYTSQFMSRDLAAVLEPAEGSETSFSGRFPSDFLDVPATETLLAWHLVGGKDPLESEDLTGDEPSDGVPVLLRDWIRSDGLKCLKVKLRGDDADWDFDRLVRVGRIAIDENADWLSSDFNCTVLEANYVNEILDRLMREYPRIYGMLLYVEQPFPYDLEAFRMDVRSVAARKPLFMDESAHDWRLIRLGRSLGWSGVALKTCKTQTGALLSLAWAKAHGMTLMVQDLSNPMLAQIPHVQLAAHAGTIMGVETNGMQFYPAASEPEAIVHPGFYRRRNGRVSLSTLRGSGFGYRLDEIGASCPNRRRRLCNKNSYTISIHIFSHIGDRLNKGVRPPPAC